MPINQSASQYFISCVSKELGSYRRMLKHHLSALRGGVEVKIQEDFIQGNDTLLEELNAFVRDCEGVIHLVGERCGELPTDQHVQVLEQLLKRPVENRYSMTQWEYHLARHHDKRTLVYLTGPETRIDEPVKQHANAAAIQQAHRVGIHESGKFYGQFNNHQQLRRLVFRDLGLDEGRYIANLPFASLGSLFKGRDEVLTTLKDGLGLQDHRHYQGVMAITANTTAASVHGLGGIGKTRAAVEFAVQYREDYCALLFCIADTPSALINNIAAFCGPKLLDLPAQHEKETELQYQAVLHWLKQHPGWLLIIDNVDSEEAATAVQKLAGELSGSGQILITSRISDWPGSMLTAALDVLDSSAAIAFLLERTDRAKGRRKADDDEQQAALLAETLGYLPLALEQAGAYICIHEISFAEYLAEWESKREIILNSAHARVMEYPFSVAVTWLTSFDKLTENARNLLYRLAWFSFEPIPESLLDVAIPGVNEDLGEALSNLADYSLVTWDRGASFFSIHRLVQEITRKTQINSSSSIKACIQLPAFLRRMIKNDHAFLSQSIQWILPLFNNDMQDVRAWPSVTSLMPHAITITNHSIKNKVDKNNTSALMNQLGLLLLSKARYNEAESLLRTSLKMEQQRSQPNLSEVATKLQNLALILKDTSRISEAEDLLTKAININESLFGKNHPNVALNLSLLALIHEKNGRFSDAEKLVRCALRIDTNNFGLNHPKTAIRLNNLAQILFSLNRLPEAAEAAIHALQINQEHFGENHPTVATNMFNLAHIYSAEHRFKDAEELLSRSLKIVQHSYGDSHPETAASLHSLAVLLKKQGQYENAENALIRSLEINEGVSLLSHKFS